MINLRSKEEEDNMNDLSLNYYITLLVDEDGNMDMDMDIMNMEIGWTPNDLSLF